MFALLIVKSKFIFTIMDPHAVKALFLHCFGMLAKGLNKSFVSGSYHY